MKFLKNLFSGEKPPRAWAVLSCSGCQNVYSIGNDAIAVSAEAGYEVTANAVVLRPNGAAEQEDLVSGLNDVPPVAIEAAKDRVRLNLETIRIGLRRGDNRRWRCYKCNTSNSYPMEWAGAKDTPQLGLLSQKDLSATHETGWWPLIRQAATEGRKDIADDLSRINYDARINYPARREELFGAQSTWLEQERRERAGWTPLHWTSSKPSFDTSAWLLTHGVDVNAKAPNGLTALHYASLRGFKDIVALLLLGHAEVDAKVPTNSYTPLHFAAENGHGDVVKILLAQGANVNSKNSENHTPLYLAAGNGRNSSVVELLLAMGANVNAKDASGKTPLHMTAEQDRKNMAELLLAHGADIDARDSRGRTPLHYAALEGQERVARLLLSSGADVNARANSGETPLCCAFRAPRPALIRKHYDAVLELLRQHGGQE